MSRPQDREAQVQNALKKINLPPHIQIRAWAETDFPAIQQLSHKEGWPTPTKRPNATLTAWRHSWPALVATHKASVIGFIRALTDQEITTYIAELLVAPAYRGQGIGRHLLNTCHHLFPNTRIDLLSTDTADQFYQSFGCKPFQGYRKSYI